ncbi:MAG: hypothetical protein HY736_10770, partial [Verrucomicrobia bacterium]|nr:hypothetical protein [Verrucomicrobiota bacterium]
MFAVLHIADFALHAVLRTEPVLGGRPAALLDGARKKALVLAATAGARAAGVEPGMTAPQALARCATLMIRTPQPAAETEARAALLAVGFTLSPSIEDTAPGICTIDLKGVDTKKLAPAAHAAVTGLVQLGLPATAGIAPTPLLALYAARIAPPNRSRSLNLSRSSSEKSPTACAADDRNRARALNRNRSPAPSITSTSKITSTSNRETDAASFLSPSTLNSQLSAPNPVLVV